MADKKHTGIGFRRDIADEINAGTINPAFIEFAPENWMEIGGQWGKTIREAASKYPVTCHGLSLSVGSPDPLDYDFISRIKSFLNQFNVQVYSEHLSYTKANNAHLYDLLPVPFTHEAVDHIVARIKEVQDLLGRKLVLENVSYYTPVAAEMPEHEFISTIAKEADCQLLLDVNNVFVNAFNHQYDATAFIDSLPLEKVAYIHMAGHEKVEEDLIIDTHGQPIIDPVYDLFEETIAKLNGPVPVLLERDYNFSELDQLNKELNKIERICNKVWEKEHVHTD